MKEREELLSILKIMHNVVVFYTRVLILFSFFTTPFIYFLIYLKKKRNGDPAKILIIPQLTRIGDIICSSPVVRAIKARYPDCSVSILVSANASGIIKNDPRIDEVILLEDYKENFPGLIRKIREGEFDWGVSLSGTALSTLLFFFGMIPNRMKIVRGQRPVAEILTDWLCNVKVKYAHISYLPAFYLKMLEHLEIYDSNTKKEVFFNEQSQKNAEDFLKKESVFPRDRIVGISITAGNKIKEWGDEKFEIIARKIVERYGARIVFIGGSRDRERIAKLVERLGNSRNYISAAGFALEDLPALMNRFSVFVSVDTGPIHIAEALGILLIDILGPVNDIELTPRGENTRIIKSPANIPPTIFAFRREGSSELTKTSLNAIPIDVVLDAFYDVEKKYLKWV